MIKINVTNLITAISIVFILIFSSCSPQIYNKPIEKSKTSYTSKNESKKSEIKDSEKEKSDIKDSEKEKSTKKSETEIKKSKTDDPILLAEETANKGGKEILEEGRKMALIDKVILPGSCWNWINTAYNNAGYTNSNGKRKTIFKSKKNGPYVKTELIEPGDWLYYINHSYNDIEHSGIFVYWVDYKKKIGMILSYGGESRKQPGRYLPYDLTHVYNIIRAVSE
ncbi:MAG: hypothetical protein JXR51_12695 [Bacteroidales bacterium]|nr:hypothetical protein [Bacteroidales bacterium]MBN2758028.1 hypothetical protein [Bacteroidales bacterium]